MIKFGSITICMTLAVLALSHYSHGIPLEAIESEPMLGHIGEPEPANGVIQEMVQNQADVLRKLLGRDRLDHIEAISFSKQIVRGINYFIKCKITDSNGQHQIIHIKIHRDIKAEPQLHGFSEGHTLESPINYFD